MTLGEKQRTFSRNLARLIEWAFLQGYEIAIGEVERRPDTAKANAAAGIGIANSLHLIRLAADLHLFMRGLYLTESHQHEPLGKYWKTLHPDNRWGGDFSKPDGNHYSMTHEGRQ